MSILIMLIPLMSPTSKTHTHTYVHTHAHSHRNDWCLLQIANNKKTAIKGIKRLEEEKGCNKNEHENFELPTLKLSEWKFTSRKVKSKIHFLNLSGPNKTGCIMSFRLLIMPFILAIIYSWVLETFLASFKCIIILTVFFLSSGSSYSIVIYLSILVF